MLIGNGYYDSLSHNFMVVEILCFLNSSFVISHIVTAIYTKRMGRFFDFPTMLHFLDTMLLILSMVIVEWIENDLYYKVNTPVTTFEDKERLVLNFAE